MTAINEQKYTLTNLLRIVISCVSLIVGFYYDLKIIQYCFAVHFFLASLWFVLIQFDILLEKNHIWSGFLPLSLDIVFVTAFVLFSGSSGSFAILVYVLISALSSLEARFNYGMFASLLGPAAYTVAGILLLTGAVPHIDMLGMKTDLNWFKLGISSLVLFISCFTVSRMLHGLILKNDTLLKKEEEARKKDHERQEKRYHTLVENSSDIIFTLDSQFRIVSLNRAFTKYLGFPVSAWIGRSFRDLVKTPEGSIGSLLFEEKLAAAGKGERTAPIYLNFLTFVGDDSRMCVQMEKTHFEDGDMISGSAQLTLDDALLGYFVSERQKFVLNNFITLADQASDRITRSLSRFVDRDTVIDIRLSIREALINAIEHGNLEIDYEMKSKAIASGDYLAFIQRRQKEERYKNRVVVVEYSLNPRRVIYRITDQGAGFDHRRMIEQMKENIHKNISEHGRGIAIMAHMFDELEYNDRGNQILMRKFFHNR